MPDRPRPEPRLLRREDAALYAGIGPTLFDRLVSEGKMPAPVRIEGRVLWDRWALDAKITELSDGDGKLEFAA